MAIFKAISILLLFLQPAQTRAYADLSIGKPATQRPLWSCGHSEICRLYEAGNAVDRDINTCMRTAVIGRSFLYKEVEWQVDLGGIRSVYQIRILFRSYDEAYVSRQRGRFAGFSLHLSNSPQKEDGDVCYKDGPELPPLDFDTMCIGHARYVTFHNERLDNKTYPDGYESLSVTEICEVIVQGCEQGMYGQNCSLPCSDNCQERRCDVINGTCLVCLPGWIGNFCEQSCSSGSYGLECKQNCSGHCKYNTTCNPITGECKFSCAGGWSGDQCNYQCPLGTYGPNCVSNCSTHCLISGHCERETGQCSKGCSPGYTRPLCHKVCSPGTFGHDCSSNCSGHCIDEENCRNTDGICINGCAPGYKGNLCNQACLPGFYGSNCTTRCSKTCIDTCRHINGVCLCAPGWTGSPHCNKECPAGSYGVNCKQICSSHCISDEICNRFDGSCTRGCKEPFTGLTCHFQKYICEESYTAGLATSIALNIVALLTVVIFTTLLRFRYICIVRQNKKKSEDHIKTKSIMENPKTGDGNKECYEELEVKENNTRTYQGLNISETKTSYQNFAFMT